MWCCPNQISAPSIYSSGSAAETAPGGRSFTDSEIHYICLQEKSQSFSRKMSEEKTRRFFSEKRGGFALLPQGKGRLPRPRKKKRGPRALRRRRGRGQDERYVTPRYHWAEGAARSVRRGKWTDFRTNRKFFTGTVERTVDNVENCHGRKNFCFPLCKLKSGA